MPTFNTSVTLTDTQKRRTSGRTDECMNGRTTLDGRTDGRMDEWTDGRVDEWTHGRTDERTSLDESDE